MKLWCEKEFRNLKRIFDCGRIAVPEPIHIHDNILVMKHLDNTVRLADVAKYLSFGRLEKIYYSLVRVIRDMWLHCGLVHGDLSEYNVLY